MSYARALARQLDTDLIERLESSGKPEERRAAKTARKPRPAGSYRGSRRNEARAARQGGERKPMITFADIKRVNAMHAKRMQAQGETK